ncbi:MAG: restriction endonuclease subunit S [Planctomycetales bacterium]|nr:restriction endonuclease subunit S [Planctomycetales bacterium]
MNAGWEIKTVSEVAKHSLGKMLDKAKNKGTPRDYLRNVNVRWFTFDLSDLLQMRFLDDEEPKFTATKGDVLICEGGYPGRAAIWDEDYPIHFQKAIHRVRFHEPERNKWFVYHLHFLDLSGELRQYFTGTGIQHFTGETLARLPIPLPPLAEQRRIVGILDEAFEGLATAKANAEQNLQNARALFESHLQAVFTQRGDGWGEKTIEEVCVIGDGNHSSNYPTKDELVEVGVPFIRATNLVAGRVSGYDMRFLSAEKHAQLKKGHLKTGDILITNRGEIGKTAIVDSAYDNANLNSQIAWLRCRDGMKNKFLFHVLNSSDIQQHFQSSKSGAALQQFTIKQLKALKVPSPPMPKQHVIVEQLDSLSEETQRLESLYQRKLAALDELKKSLLHRAFSGQL